MATPLTHQAPRDSTIAAAHPDSAVFARAEAALAMLLDALKHLSSHRDDAAAIAALNLLDGLRAAAPTISAQEFQRYYYRIHDRSLTHGDPARPEWRQAHRLAADALQALLWVWRVGGAGARTAARTTAHDLPAEMECGR